VAYYEQGPSGGEVVVLLHGFPYDIHSFTELIPKPAEAGYRVITPYLRGHAATRFVAAEEPRSGQQAALGADLVALMDALSIGRAIFAGYDWGGRAACVAAALWPERCRGLVTVGGYLIQDIAAAVTPISPNLEAGLWSVYYFLTERGRAGLAASRKDIARVIWRRNLPDWNFTEQGLDRSAAAFQGDDYVDVVVHSYRHRLGFAPGLPEYEEIEATLAMQPPISVPAITLDGLRDSNFPANRRSLHRPLLHRSAHPPHRRRQRAQLARGAPGSLRHGDPRGPGSCGVPARKPRHHSGPRPIPAELGVSLTTQSNGERPMSRVQTPHDALAGSLTRTVLQHAASSIPGRDIVQVLTEIPAGVQSGWHMHPGEEVGYILAGTVEMEIEGQPSLTLHAGDPFLMSPRTPHNATDLGPETGQMLSTYIVEADEPIAKFTR
jgi:pimeloyl-ACP methyl ester carboxylesterase/quercetin dioxygenase-like cupin family protein